jgi:hypothetical protein
VQYQPWWKNMSQNRSLSLKAAGVFVGLASLLTSSAIFADMNATPGKMLASGGSIEIKKLGVTITPPAGWEVITNAPNISLIMQEPADTKVVYDKPIYQRNITLAAAHAPEPIDEKRAIKLREQLMAKFGKDGMVKDFRIIEHRFFDYKGTKDGLLVFTQFETGEFPMMQMHMLVSGDSKQFLLSYTDLQERFSDQTSYDKAWATMTSINVTGVAPRRYERIGVVVGLAAMLIISMICFFSIRSRRERASFEIGADELESDSDFEFDGLTAH